MERVLDLDLEQLRDLDADLDLGMTVAYACEQKPTIKQLDDCIRILTNGIKKRKKKKKGLQTC